MIERDGRELAAGVGAGVAAGASAPRTAAEHVPSRRGCATRDDPDADARSSAPFDEPRRLRHPRRRHALHASAAATGPPILFCTASRSRRASGPSSSTCSRRRVPRGRVRPPRATASRRPATTGHSIDNLADDVRTCSRASTCTTPSSSATRWAGMAVQAFAIRHPDIVARARARARADVDGRRDVDLHRRRRSCRRRRRAFAPGLVRSACVTRRDWSTLAARSVRRDPHPSHVELDPQMLARDRGETPSSTCAARSLRFDLTRRLPRRSPCPRSCSAAPPTSLTPPRRRRGGSPRARRRPPRVECRARATCSCTSAPSGSTHCCRTSRATSGSAAGAALA